ncbi:MAG: Trk system potassium transporter TrkA [Acidimicrobiaceae bacterium]|nr:Trk system potassium transporter TrkA [Acidimicrobiia bacterium]MCY4495193.1 Trk system potassium transporter TrkA [Acidimicrobiaceae bacterium]
MHVIVVGAGEVGTYVADRLSREGHDVAIIDLNRERLRKLDEDLDVLVVEGSGTHPETLRRAGVEEASLVVAVTKDDAVNLVCSQLSKLLGAKRTIVRIEASELRGKQAAKLRQAAAVDLVIDPDSEAAEDVLELIDHPGADEVEKMAGGEVLVIGARLSAASPLVGRSLSDVGKEFEPEWEFVVGSIGRGDETIIPRRNHHLEAGDHIRLAVKKRARSLVTELLGLERSTLHRVMLLGGGRTAEILAQRLAARGIYVVIVERSPQRARALAECLDEALIIEGDITDADLLEEADVGRFDMIVALTGEDDANILACLYAKSSGAGETVAVVHRLALLKLLGDVGIDVALSPRTATANGVLRFVRGDVAAVATFLHGDTEVLELEVAVDSPADGALVKHLGLPKDVLIGAFVRDGKAQIARGRSRLRGRDRIVAFAVPAAVEEVRRAFG